MTSGVVTVASARLEEEHRPVTCRDCGEPGVEAWHDPAPSLCPSCFVVRMDGATAWLREQERLGEPTTDLLSRFFGRLRRVGLRPAAAARDVRVLAGILGVPCPKNALAAADRRWEAEAARVLGQEPGA